MTTIKTSRFLATEVCNATKSADPLVHVTGFIPKEDFDNATFTIKAYL